MELKNTHISVKVTVIITVVGTLIIIPLFIIMQEMFVLDWNRPIEKSFCGII